MSRARTKGIEREARENKSQRRLEKGIERKSLKVI